MEDEAAKYGLSTDNDNDDEKERELINPIAPWS